jgi:methyltransferase (TIGR00027 family)
MKTHRPSRTAEHNALFRAIESARAPQRRIVCDRFAREFLGNSFRFVALLSRIPALSGLLRTYIDYRWPGSRTSLIARTRWIDDYLTASLADGASQVVILGAGFDSRAYRIPGAEKARFFEVDHPNTSAAKTAHVLRLFGRLPEHVKYVQVNFQQDSLMPAIESAGFTPECKTLVIWEGVSNYLTEEAVRETLRFVASLRKGTTILFTYVDRTAIEAPTQFAGGKEVQRLFAKLDEPWTFGICPNNAAEFCSECGLCVDRDLSADEYRAQYYGPQNCIKGYGFYHLTIAHVPGSEASLDTNTFEVHHA